MIEDNYLQFKCYWSIKFQAGKDLNGIGEGKDQITEGFLL